MTLYLDSRAVGGLVNTVGLPRFWRRLADYLAQDFRRWQAFDKAPRVAAYAPHGVIELMPISDGETYAFKCVNGHPGNAARRLQTVVAFGALADVATGYPQLLCDMTLATALRTAATSALAARFLAPPGARTMALIGLGAQAEFQASAFAALPGVERLRIFDIDPEATKKFERNMAGSGLALTRCANVADAAFGAEIITTATADKRRANILTSAMVTPGTHVNGIGGDCPGKTEIEPALLQRASIFVEYEPQTRIEGDIQQLAPDHEVTELWEVIAGRRQGRSRDDEITLFDSVGFALEDFSVLRLLRDLAREHDAGEEIDLLPAPADPKNLFGELTATKNQGDRRCA